MKDSPPSDWMPPPAPEPLGPELLERAFPWLELGLGVAVLLVFGLVIWISWKRSRKRSSSTETPLELALQAIEVAKQSEGTVMASELSLIVRSYLFSKTKDQAIYETSEELSRRPAVLKTLTASSRHDSLALLGELDQLRYRPEIEAPEIAALAEESANLLQRIDQELELDDLSS